MPVWSTEEFKRIMEGLVAKHGDSATGACEEVALGMDDLPRYSLWGDLLGDVREDPDDHGEWVKWDDVRDILGKYAGGE